MVVSGLGTLGLGGRVLLAGIKGMAACQIKNTLKASLKTSLLVSGMLLSSIALWGNQLAMSQPVAEMTDGSQSVTLSAVELDLKTGETYGRADSHAPIGVMGDHTHNKGDIMLSYRYMMMRMTGSRDGTKDLSRQEVLSRYMVAPTAMTMHMHMLGLMAAPHDKLTLSVMAPYIHTAMDHQTRMGQKFTTRSEGFGDIQGAALVPIIKTDNHELLLKAGVSFPTADLNERDDTPTQNDARLPYPMQLGSGTFDLMPGITYRGQSESLSWGVQSGGTIRLGKNKNDYRLGNRVYITPWVAKKWKDWLTTSVRLNGQAWGDIQGADPQLNPRMVQTANPNNQKGRRLDLLFGVNLLKTKGFLKNHRLAFEMGFPIYQHLQGPQLETDFILTAGWQWSI